jgi:hypothetical protein
MVKVFHMELRQNLLNGLGDIWDSQFMALYKFWFIMDQYS